MSFILSTLSPNDTQENLIEQKFCTQSSLYAYYIDICMIIIEKCIMSVGECVMRHIHQPYRQIQDYVNPYKEWK